MVIKITKFVLIIVILFLSALNSLQKSISKKVGIRLIRKNKGSCNV